MARAAGAGAAGARSASAAVLTTTAPRRTPALTAHAAFYPAAALYAAVALPASVLGMLGFVPALPGLAAPAGHAHEMIFGFGLAAVAGNQMGPAGRRFLAIAAATWIAARLAFVLAPDSPVAAIANAAFAAMVAIEVAPRLASVRKLRNRALPAAVVALCVAALAWEATRVLGGALPPQGTQLLAAVLVLAMLMVFMGGRILAPVSDLASRVQPRLEGASLAAMAVAIVAVLLGLASIAGLAAAAAAILTAARLVRWRPWRLRGRADILGFAIGYAWLAAGLAAIALALLSGTRPVAALHVVTIGAMGTLSINVMATTWARVARIEPAKLRAPPWATALIALALAARLAADWAEWPAGFAAAAACWSIAFVLLLATFARIRAAL